MKCSRKFRVLEHDQVIEIDRGEVLVGLTHAYKFRNLRNE